GSDPALAADYTRINASMMLMKDGPEHHRMRVLGNHAFTPSALGRWQSVIERVVDELLDAALPRGRMDLIGELARPLPAIVIAELFGIPPEDRETFHNWSMNGARFFGGAVGDPEEAARAANEAGLQQERYFLGLLEERRRRPGDDLMSLLLEGQAEGRLSAEEVCAQRMMLLGAGHITTMDQLGNTVLALRLAIQEGHRTVPRTSTSPPRASSGPSSSCKQEPTCPRRRSPPAPASRIRASSAITSSASSASRRGSSGRQQESPNRSQVPARISKTTPYDSS